MCCFSQAVEHVGATKIFARRTSETHQLLVYSMSVVASHELAMILPLPVSLPAGEDAVRFIDLQEYSTFFDDMESGFPAPQSRGFDATAAMEQTDTDELTLAVHDVGDFEASFAPSIPDLDRLDARFRLPATTWDRVAGYADFGFAVFKLKAHRDAQLVHPMALEFAIFRRA